MVIDIIIVHIPFKLGYRASGGGIRPQKMIKAFKDLGHEVLIVEGDHRQRADLFKKAWGRYLRGEIRVNFIYSESSSNPTILTDRKNWLHFRDFYYLLRFHAKKIPVLLFYRDVHWNFQVAPKNYSLLKWTVLKVFYYIDIFSYLAFVDVLLLPSLRMKEYVPFAEKFLLVDELPPGHDSVSNLPLRTLNKNLSGMYVGGVLPPVYDISDLIILKDIVTITICCRVDEWERVKDYYGPSFTGVKIIHTEGIQLSELLSSTHLSLMVRSHHDYLKFSQPLKFYEAIGFELPIVVSEESLVSELVKEWDIGWVYSGNVQDLNFDDYDHKVNNIRKIKALHSWSARAHKVVGLALR